MAKRSRAALSELNRAMYWRRRAAAQCPRCGAVVDEQSGAKCVVHVKSANAAKVLAYRKKKQDMER